MRPSRWAPLTAHGLAWAGFFGVLLGPFGYGSQTITVFPDGGGTWSIGHGPGPLILYLGVGEVMLLLAPVALTGLGVWLAWRRRAGPVRTRLTLWGLALAVLAYCWIAISYVDFVTALAHRSPGTSFDIVEIEFIGGLFMPAAVALIVSAIIVSFSKPTPDAAQDR